ncbi:MAG: hypothetical protein JXR68_10265 [Bacteroidales bacterium]|nr:hypothetical protein [Bacteroidales bacterium]
MKKIIPLVVFAFILFSCSDQNNSSNTNNQVVIDTSAISNMSAEEIVRFFIESIGNRGFELAYFMQNNPQWGNLDNFSSDQLFGKYLEAEIVDIIEKPDSTGYKVFVVDAYYWLLNKTREDRFKHKIILKQTSSGWKVVDMIKLFDYNWELNKFENFVENIPFINLPYNNELFLDENAHSYTFDETKFLFPDSITQKFSSSNFVFVHGKFITEEFLNGIIISFDLNDIPYQYLFAYNFNNECISVIKIAHFTKKTFSANDAEVTEKTKIYSTIFLDFSVSINKKTEKYINDEIDVENNQVRIATYKYNNGGFILQ